MSQLATWPIYKLCVVCFGICRHRPAAPIITSALLRKLLFVTRWRPASSSSSSVRHAENTKANIFFWGRYSVLPEGFIDPAHVHFLEPPSIFSIPPPPQPVSEAATGAPPLGSPLRKAPRWADETRPRAMPNSRCELYKRLPFSPDIHKKDSLCSPPLKFNFSICSPSCESLFVPLFFL